MKKIENAICIPVCPEQLGGLATPREAAEIENGNGHDVLAGKTRVVTLSGEDVTNSFIKGAEQVLSIVQHQKVDGIFLKAKSPSCGVHEKLGVTTALLLQHGYTLEEF